MPSFRHEMIVQMIGMYVGQPPAADTAELAERVLAKRTRESLEPPANLRARAREVPGDLGFPVYEIHPTRPASGTPPILYLGGGELTTGITPQRWNFATRISQLTGAVVTVPLYPLVPEATWLDSREGLLSLIVDAPGPAPLLLGTAAGGGLALALAASAHHDHGVTDVPGLALVSPWVDLTMPGPDADYQAANDPQLTARDLRLTGRLWAGEQDPADPRISPLYADLSGLPPTLVFSGTREVLHAQALELHERINASGGRCELEVGRGLILNYPLLASPEGKAATAKLTAFVERRA